MIKIDRDQSCDIQTVGTREYSANGNDAKGVGGEHQRLGCTGVGGNRTTRWQTLRLNGKNRRAGECVCEKVSVLHISLIDLLQMSVKRGDAEHSENSGCQNSERDVADETDRLKTYDSTIYLYGISDA